MLEKAVANATTEQVQNALELGRGEPAALVRARRKTHGDWQVQAGLATGLKFLVRATEGYDALTAMQKEAVEMILVKISRIVAGNADEPDHWRDIQGYAELGMKGHDQ